MAQGFVPFLATARKVSVPDALSHLLVDRAPDAALQTLRIVIPKAVAARN
jgi:hypothetical protein